MHLNKILKKMKINRTVKIIAGSILGIFVLLFLVLVVHIATAKPLVIDNASLQISRIDFKEPIDSLKAKEIHRNLKKIPGVKTDRLNIETGVLLLKRIRDRVDKPTPEKIGTLYNSLSKDNVTAYGEYVGKVYKEKPWKRLD